MESKPKNSSSAQIQCKDFFYFIFTFLNAIVIDKTASRIWDGVAFTPPPKKKDENIKKLQFQEKTVRERLSFKIGMLKI